MSARRPRPEPAGSRSSPGCRAPAGPRPRTRSRISGSSSSTTCRRRCCRRWPSSRCGPAVPDARRDRGRRPRRRVLRRAVEGARGAPEHHRDAPDRVPEASDDDLVQPVRGDAPPAPAGARRPGGRGHPQGAADDGAAARRGGPRHRHVGPDARTSCATGCATRSPTRRPKTASRSRWSRSASSTGRRATPTCCSTCGSCRTRTGSRSCGPHPGTDPTVRDYVRGSELYADLSRAPRGAARRHRSPATSPRARAT